MANSFVIYLVMMARPPINPEGEIPSDGKHLPWTVRTILNIFPVTAVGHPDPPAISLTRCQYPLRNCMGQHVFPISGGIHAPAGGFVNLQPVVQRHF